MQTIADIAQRFGALREQLDRVIIGQNRVKNLAITSLIAGGHMLLEGAPGTGKTLLALSLSRLIGCRFRRIQFTPDLMPSDLLGANIFNQKTQEFALRPGPVFTDVLLADEINRTPPKTQSALLEAMQERSVTIDGTTHKLSGRFTVLATQNPIEQEGTYPLPEAQLDRFLFKLDVGYPNVEQELKAVMTHSGTSTMPSLDALGVNAVLDASQVDELREAPAKVHFEPRIGEYVVGLARATRQHPSLAVGISPRAATMLSASARAAALCSGRDFTLPDDVKALFLSLARHRVVLTPSAEMEGLRVASVLEEILGQIAPPR